MRRRALASRTAHFWNSSATTEKPREGDGQYCWLVSSLLLCLAMLASACSPSGRPPSPAAISTLQFQAITVVPSATSTATLTPTPFALAPPITPIEFTPYVLYRITVYNRYAWEMFVFIDGRFLGRVPAGQSFVFFGIEPGSHKLLYCQDLQMQACLSAALTVERDTVFIAGETPTPLPTPTGLQITPRGTLPPDTWLIIVYNLYPFPMQVYIDCCHERLRGCKPAFTAAKRTYTTYLGVKTGEHKFRFCFVAGNPRTCVTTRRLNITTDTEIWVSP